MKTENIKIKPQWEKSKEEIWNDLFEELEETPKVIKMVPRKRNIWFYAAASIAAIAIILPSIAFFYTENKIAEKGIHLAVVLPDGSKVELNADSEISYKPLWWMFSREVKLKGEAYFEVEKGSTFNVHSGEYTTSVLGTSFNIFSRANKFNVTCLSGKVNVSGKSESVILTKNMQALWDSNRLIAKDIEDAVQSINWKQGKFIFIGVPLQEVIQEIERQYDITVSPNSGLNQSYSGNFTKTEKPDDVLQIVGKPFGIKFKIE